MAKDKRKYKTVPAKYSYDYAQKKYKHFKQNEKQFDIQLEHNFYYIIRFDGKGMTKGFKIKRQAINKSFFDTMDATFNEFCKATNITLFGYSFSDEISILIRRSSDDEDDYNRVEKLLSLLSSKLSLIFYRNAQKNNLDLHDKDWIFDARLLQLKEQEVVNYFLARQAYAIDKYIMQLKTEHGVSFKLKTSKLVLSQLHNLGITYENLPAKYRYGLIYSPTIQQTSFEFDSNKSLLRQMCFGK